MESILTAKPKNNVSKNSIKSERAIRRDSTMGWDAVEDVKFHLRQLFLLWRGKSEDGTYDWAQGGRLAQAPGECHGGKCDRRFASDQVERRREEEVHEST